MAFNWDDQEEGEFRDMPEGVFGNQPPDNGVVNAATMSPKQPQQQRSAQQLPQVIQEPDHDFGGDQHDDGSQEKEEDFEAVLADANLRIELATLYKMIMNHDLFEGMDSDPRAIETVTRGIRKFAREQMEIMLGMRREATRETTVSSPFNDLEVMVLKKMASQMSKGATETAAAHKPQPAAKAIARREGLNTIGGGTKAAPRPVPIQTKQPLASKQQTPIQRPAKPQAPVIQDEDYQPLTKPLHEMTEVEREQRNKEASARQADRKSVKSSTALPMPTADQEEMYHTQRAMTSDHPLASHGAVSAILMALNKSKQ